MTLMSVRTLCRTAACAAIAALAISTSGCGPIVGRVDVSPNPAKPGQKVNFDASGSFAAVSTGNSYHYDWDLDGNGTYEVTTSTPKASKTYSAEGAVHVKVQVTDDGTGDTGTADNFVVVKDTSAVVQCGPGQVGYGGSCFDQPSPPAQCPDGTAGAGTTCETQPAAPPIAGVDVLPPYQSESPPNVDQPDPFAWPVYNAAFGQQFAQAGQNDRQSPTIAVGPNKLYVATNIGPYPVRVYDATSLAAVGQFGNGSGDAGVVKASGIAYYRGEVFVSDAGANKVKVFDENGNYRRSFCCGYSGIDVAWGEVWGRLNDTASRLEARSADTGALRSTVALRNENPTLPQDDGLDHRPADVSVGPEFNLVATGEHFIDRNPINSLFSTQTELGDADAYSETYGSNTCQLPQGGDWVWGMRWYITVTSCPSGPGTVREESIGASGVTLPFYGFLANDVWVNSNATRSWDTHDTTAGVQRDVAYRNREATITWNGPLTTSSWQRGTKCLAYVVSDADIYIAGAIGERWYEPARNFQQIQLVVDGQVKGTRTAPTDAVGQWCIDTAQYANRPDTLNGPHKIELVATVAGKTINVANDTLRLDNALPAQTLDAVPPYARGTVSLSGTYSDAHSGPRDWAVQGLPPGATDWNTQAVTICGGGGDASGRYSCNWNTVGAQEGLWNIRTRARDNSSDAQQMAPTATTADDGNMGYTATSVTLVDNTNPGAVLSGDLWDGQDLNPFHPGDAPALSIAATDARSGVKSVETLVDGVRADYVEQGCGGGGCPLNRSYTFDPAVYKEGQHTIDVVTTDLAGNTNKQSWTVDVEATGQDPDTDPATSPPQGSASPAGTATTRAATPGLPSGTPVDSAPCTIADATRNFDVFSLGPNFEQLPETDMIRRCDPPDPQEGSANFVSYIYGDCQPDMTDEDPSCAAPLEIQSWPACQRNLASYSQGPDWATVDYTLTTVNGLPGATFDDGMRVEVYTGTTTVVIFGGDPTQVLRAAGAIRQEPGSAPPITPTAMRTAPLAPPVPGATTGALPC